MKANDLNSKIRKKISLGAFILDNLLNIKVVNSYLLKLVGKEEAEGGFLELLSHHDAERLRTVLMKLKDGEGLKENIRLANNVLVEMSAIRLGEEIFGMISEVGEVKYSEFEETLKILSDNTLVGIIIFQDDHYVYVNPAIERFTGYTPEELKKMHFWEVIHPDMRKLIKKRGLRRQRGERVKPLIYDFPYITKNGEVRWALASFSNTIYNGKPAGVAIAIDITDRKRAEKELEKEKKKFEEFFHKSPVATIIVDKDGVVVDANEEFERLSGYSRDEIAGHHFEKFVAGDDTERVREHYRKRMNGEGVPERCEFRLEKKDGEIKDVENKIIRLPDGNLLSCIIDFTDRKKMLDKLKESEEMFRKLAEGSLVGVYLIQDSVFKYVNPVFAGYFGCGPEDLVNRDVYRFVHPEDVETVRERVERRVRGEEKFANYNFRIISRDGETREIEIFGTRVEYRGKPAIIGTAIDRTKEEEYRRRLEEYRRFYENARDMFFIIDSQGCFIDVNPKYAEMLGYSKEELIGRNSRMITHPEDIGILRENFQKVMKGESVRYEARAVARDGEVYILEIVMWPVYDGESIIGAEGILRDITEKKMMEQEIIKSELKFRLIFENSPNMIALIDENGYFVEVNPAMRRSIGFNPEGKNIYNVFSDEIAERRMKHIKRAMESGKIEILEDTRNGRHFISYYVPIQILGKKSCLVIANEITEIKRLNRLLNTINNINKLIVHERDPVELFQKSCAELAGFDEYMAAWIGLIDKKRVKIVAQSKNRRLIPQKILLNDTPPGDCVRRAIEGRKLVITDPAESEICSSCPYYQLHKNLKTIAVPLSNGKIRGTIVIYSIRDPAENETELIQTLAKDLSFALRSLEIEKLKEDAYKKIEHNIEQFAILADEIRNPLAIISGFAELSSDYGTAKRILEQVERIEKIADQLDRGWLESEEIRKFLREYG
jgi:PAS domain S-box-containing protein